MFKRPTRSYGAAQTTVCSSGTGPTALLTLYMAHRTDPGKVTARDPMAVSGGQGGPSGMRTVYRFGAAAP